MLRLQLEREHQVVCHPRQAVELALQFAAGLEVRPIEPRHQPKRIALGDTQRTTEVVRQHGQQVRLAGIQAGQSLDRLVFERELARQSQAQRR